MDTISDIKSAIQYILDNMEEIKSKYHQLFSSLPDLITFIIRPSGYPSKLHLECLSGCPQNSFLMVYL